MENGRNKKTTQEGADLAQAAREYANKVWLNFYKEYEKFLMSNKECGKSLPKDLIIWEVIHKAYEKGAAWQKQRLIDKAYDFLAIHLDMVRKDIAYTDEEFIKDFIKETKE